MLRRPAARARIRRPAVRDPAAPALGGWLDVGQRCMEELRIGEDILVEMIYEGEKGQAFCFVQDKIEDELGRWIGVKLRGTNLAGLRHWRLNRGGGSVRPISARMPSARRRGSFRKG